MPPMPNKIAAGIRIGKYKADSKYSTLEKIRTTCLEKTINRIESGITISIEYLTSSPIK